MLVIKNLKVNLADSQKEILHGVNLTINESEIHILNGKNGSGKSTLVNTVMGNPSFQIASGEIFLEEEKINDFTLKKFDEEFILSSKNGKYNVNLTNANPDLKSNLGLFLASQYPVEISGVSLMSFLRLIYNSRRSESERLPVFKFRKLVEERAEFINYPPELLKRNLNEGFSGGEKKKTEILQMLILEPKYVFLDEIDSGLDKHSVKEVFEGLKKYKQTNPTSSFVIITHYEKALEYLTPNFVHEMENGALL